MNIHEHQAKEILKEFGAPISNGVVVFSIDGNKPDWSEDIENGLIEPWDTITRLDFSKNYNLENSCF